MLIIHLSENISEPSIDGENETIFTPLNIGIGSGVAGILGLVIYFGFFRNKTPGPNKDLKQVAIDKLNALKTSELGDFEKALKELKAIKVYDNWIELIETQIDRKLTDKECDEICTSEFCKFFGKNIKTTDAAQLHMTFGTQVLIHRILKHKILKGSEDQITLLNLLKSDGDERDKLIKGCKEIAIIVNKEHNTNIGLSNLITIINEELDNMINQLSPKTPEIKSTNKLQGELRKLEFGGFEKIMINDELFAIAINNKDYNTLALRDGEISLLNNSDSKLTLNDNLLDSLKLAKFDYFNGNFKDTSEESQKQFKANILDLMAKLNEIKGILTTENGMTFKEHSIENVNKLTPQEQAYISDAIKIIRIIANAPNKYDIKTIIQFKGFKSIKKSGSTVSISETSSSNFNKSGGHTHLDKSSIESKIHGNPSILEEINTINLDQFHTEELNKANKTFDGHLKPFLEKMNTTIDRFAEISGDTSNSILIETINREITAEESQYIADLLTIIKVIWKDELKDANFIV